MQLEPLLPQSTVPVGSKQLLLKTQPVHAPPPPVTKPPPTGVPPPVTKPRPYSSALRARS